VLRCQTLIALKPQIKPMTKISSERATFHALSEATPQDWKIIDRAEREYRRAHGPGRGLLTIMASIADIDPQGTPINLYMHCLQTATRVLTTGLDDELVVVSLFHDLPEAFSDNHHGLVAAEMLAPWLSERRRWLLIHHVEFQNHHFANHPTRDRNERNRYIGHRYFAETAEFCERYDQNSFDPDYPTLPLEAFEPIVRRFFSGPPPPIQLQD
jgi:predicted HD phosphohydrolase